MRNSQHAQRSPVTARDRELVAMPSLACQLPIAFTTTKATWTEIEGQCEGCGQSLSAARMRGHVQRPTPSVATIEAVAFCTDCNLLTRFVFRVYDDLRLMVYRDGHWKTFFGRPRALWLRAARWVFGLH